MGFFGGHREVCGLTSLELAKRLIILRPAGTREGRITSRLSRLLRLWRGVIGPWSITLRVSLASDTHPQFGYIRFWVPSVETEGLLHGVGSRNLWRTWTCDVIWGCALITPSSWMTSRMSTVYSLSPRCMSFFWMWYYFNGSLRQLLIGDARSKRSSAWGTKFAQHLNAVLSLCHIAPSNFMDQLRGLIEIHSCLTRSHPFQIPRSMNGS